MAQSTACLGRVAACQESGARGSKKRKDSKKVTIGRRRNKRMTMPTLGAAGLQQVESRRTGLQGRSRRCALLGNRLERRFVRLVFGQPSDRNVAI